MPLSIEERQEFLAGTHIGSLGVSTRQDAPPLVVPLWYYYTQGEDSLWILTGTNSMKARYINEHGCFSLMVQRLEPTVRYVGVRGPVIEQRDGTKGELRQMVSRYLPADKVEQFVEWDWNNNGPYTLYRLGLEKWISSDMGPFKRGTRRRHVA